MQTWHKVVPLWLIVAVLVCMAGMMGIGLSQGREIHFWPPGIGQKIETPQPGRELIGVKVPEPIPSRGERDQWEYLSTGSGDEAEKWLNLRHPEPQNVYAVMYAQAFHVWCKRGASTAKYTYQNFSWDPKKPLSLPLRAEGDRDIPVGLYLTQKRGTVFIYFAVN